MSVDAGLAFIDFALAREVIGFAWKGARSFALLSTYLIMYLKYLYAHLALMHIVLLQLSSKRL